MYPTDQWPTTPVVWMDEMPRCVGACQQGKIPCPHPLACSCHTLSDAEFADLAAELTTDHAPLSTLAEGLLESEAHHPHHRAAPRLPRAPQSTGLVDVLASAAALGAAWVLHTAGRMGATLSASGRHPNRADQVLLLAVAAGTVGGWAWAIWALLGLLAG